VHLTADAWTVPCPWLWLPRRPPANPYTARHQSRLRRQGDVAQEAISKAELKTYLKRVRQRIAKNPDSPAWGQLEARWLAVVEHAKGIVAASRAGKAGVRYERKAAEEILKIAAVATPRDVIETTLAMSMMEELDRRRFRSDPGFRFQLVVACVRSASCHARRPTCSRRSAEASSLRTRSIDR
jgi:hypothetical protein